MFLFAPGFAAIATEEPPPPAAKESAVPQEAPAPIDDPLERDKRRRALAGLAAVAGIAIVGVALVTLTILWARRLRRINRHPLPPTCVKNEYWFLQPPKPPVSEKGPDEGVSGE